MIDSLSELLPMLVAAVALIVGVLVMRPVSMRYDLSYLQWPAIVLLFGLFMFGSVITQNAISVVAAGIGWNVARFAVLAVMGLISGCSLAIGMQKR
jgi:hypothetical protein